MPPTGSDSRLRRFLGDPLNLVALAVALVWGSVALFLRPAGDFGVETDFYGGFATYSRRWISGHPTLMDGYRGPGYYLVLGALGWVLRDLFLAAKLISVAGAALGLRVVGALLRRLWNTPVAVAGCLAVAANPFWMEHAYRAGTDLMFWALFWAAAYLVFRGALDGRGRDWVAGGALAGAAWLTRYNGAALAPVALVALALLVRPGSRAARALLGFGVAGVAVAAPWCAFLAARTGDPLWSNSYGVIGAGLLVSPPSLATVGGFASAVDLSGWDEVFSVFPDRTTASLVRNLGEHARRDALDLMGWPWALAAVLGAAGHVAAGVRRRHAAFFLGGLGIYAFMLPVFYSPRFMLLLLPVWAAAAGGLVTLAARVGDRFRGRGPAAVRVALAGLVLAATWASVRGVLASQDPVRDGGMAVEFKALAREARRAGLAIGPGTPVAARKPHAGYYLGAPVIPIGEGTFDDIRQRGGHYLVISGVEARLYPSFLDLWNQPDVTRLPRDLRFAARGTASTAAGERVATLYAITDPVPYRPPEDAGPRPPAPPRPGFSRIDDLRVRLAAWYTAWNADADAIALLGLVAPESRDLPEARLALADALLERDDPAGAAAHYEAVLASGAYRERVLLSLAATATLRRDDEALGRYLQSFLAGRDSAAAADYGWWDDVGMEYLTRREHAACVGAFVGGLSAARGIALPIKRLGYAFYEIGRAEEARGLLSQYLAAAPDDAEAAALLGMVESKLADGAGTPEDAP